MPLLLSLQKWESHNDPTQVGRRMDVVSSGGEDQEIRVPPDKGVDQRVGTEAPLVVSNVRVMDTMRGVVPRQ